MGSDTEAKVCQCRKFDRGGALHVKVLSGSLAALVESGYQPERRDAEARATRDRLAALLDIPPGELRSIGRETAEAMITMIEAVRGQDSRP